MRQDLRLHLNLADVVMIATKVTNPAFVSLFEATHVRGDEAPVLLSKQMMFFGLAVWISTFTSIPIAII